MNENIKRFGGELEFVDVEVRDSTYEARKEFFNILDWRKPRVFSELVDLFNQNCLPDEWQNYKSLDLLTNFFLRNIRKLNLLDLD